MSPPILNLIQLLLCTLPLATSSPAGGLPFTNAKVPNPMQSKTPQTFVTTATDGTSTFTLTYVPTTVASATTIVDGTTTSTANAGAIIGVLAAGAVVAALPAAIPKAVPENVIDNPGGNDGNSNCNTKKASICTDQCTPNWFVSANSVVTTVSCSNQACSTTQGCTVTDSTTTVTATRTSHRKTVYPGVEVGPMQPTDPPPFDTTVLQAYLGQEYQRLHIDVTGGGQTTNAQCEKNPAKGSLEVAGVKTNVQAFCKSNDGGTASPDKGILLTYDQTENRMQTVLQVTYTGDRGGGTTYTIDEKSCNTAFDNILKCPGPDNSHTFGGNLTVNKGVFSIEPYTYPGKLQCAPDNAPFGVVATEAFKNTADFCAKFDAQQITQGQQKLQDYFQPTGGLMSEYIIKWEPSSTGCAPGELYDHPYPINKDACTRFLTQAINDCNKGNTTFKAGGVTTDQCASFNLGNVNREHLICADNPNYTAADRSALNPFTRDAAWGAVNDFCGQNLLAGPAAKDTSGGFSQDGTWPKGIAKGGKNGVAITVTFPSGIGSEFCPSDTPPVKAFQSGGPDCVRRLGSLIVDGCDVNAPAKKMGGSLIESGINGCVQWQLLSVGG